MRIVARCISIVRRFQLSVSAFEITKRFPFSISQCFPCELKIICLAFIETKRIFNWFWHYLFFIFFSSSVYREISELTWKNNSVSVVEGQSHRAPANVHVSVDTDVRGLPSATDYNKKTEKGPSESEEIKELKGLSISFGLKITSVASYTKRKIYCIYCVSLCWRIDAMLYSIILYL